MRSCCCFTPVACMAKRPQKNHTRCRKNRVIIKTKTDSVPAIRRENHRSTKNEAVPVLTLCRHNTSAIRVRHASEQCYGKFPFVYRVVYGYAFILPSNFGSYRVLRLQRMSSYQSHFDREHQVKVVFAHITLHSCYPTSCYNLPTIAHHAVTHRRSSFVVSLIHVLTLLVLSATIL